jgi:hypothetical protein
MSTNEVVKLGGKNINNVQDLTTIIYDKDNNLFSL